MAPDTVLENGRPETVRDDVKRTSIRVEGMSCASCVRRVEKAIDAVPGVKRATVNLATERADVAFDGSIDAKTLISAIDGAGYHAASESVDLAIKGMSCASCVGRVEKALIAAPGVVEASVNLATERASVRYLEQAVEVTDLVAAVAKAGYDAEPIGAASGDRQADARDKEIQALRRSLILSTLLATPVFVLAMGSHFVPGMQEWISGTLGEQQNRILQFVLTTLVLFGPGLRFFKKGVPALLRGGPDMNSLVVLGTTAAWGYSVVATFASSILPSGTVGVYFEAAAVIVTLILLGRFLEARAKGRTGEAIQRLAKLQSKMARIRRGGEEMEVALESVLVGDVVLVRPGERIPVDGTVVEGWSFVDESMVTGEAIPVKKEADAEVVGGTINKSGSFNFRATRVGADTVLAKIIRMVEEAQGAKLPIQTIVDKVIAWFVPAVMAAAFLTFIVWLVFGPDPALALALVNAVAVLIIACPCAMGLATPTSIMVGTGRAAEMGVLFRRGEALQTLKSAKVIALDKTGTLTNGKPELTDLASTAGYERDDILALVAAVEVRSEHPIAQSIVDAAEAAGLHVPEALDFEAMPGHGARAHVGDHDIAVGSGRMMQDLGLDIAMFDEKASQLADQGKSPLYAAVDGTLAAIIAVSDAVKPTTPDAIRALHGLGLKVAMITGDNRITAQAVARQLGIDEVEAEVLPDGKADAIKRLRERYGSVAFVGDGINDAPALAEADVGIAIGTGTDVAIESAEVVLMAGDLNGVVNAIALSQATIRNIKQNLFWAFAYNVVLIPVAAGALYPVYGILLSPMIAAAAMAFSSVFVLGNALRMRKIIPAVSPLREDSEAGPASRKLAAAE